MSILVRRGRSWPGWLWGLAAVAAVGTVAWVAERETKGLAVCGTVVRIDSTTDHCPCRLEMSPDRALPIAVCGADAREARRRSMTAVRGLLAPDEPSGIHDAGLALLAAGDRSGAVELFEAAARDMPAPATLAVLASARIELALERDDPYLLVRALDEIERARRSGVTESLTFNRALTLTLLGLRRPALEAWSEVRDAEKDTGWRSEAEARILALSLPSEADRWDHGAADAMQSWLHGAGDPAVALSVARRHPQHARQLAEEVGFAAWAKAVSSGRPETPAALAGRLVALGEVLAEVSGDDLLLRSARAALDCARSSCAALAEGHLEYSLARELHDKQDYYSADRHFALAFDLFSAARSPFALWPAFYRTIIVSHEPDFERAKEELHRLIDGVEDTSIVARGYLHWMLGLISMRRAEYEQAISEFERARDLFRVGRERENEGAMESQIAWCWDAVGRPATAWHHHARALALLDAAVKSRRIENILTSAGNGLRDQGLFAASLVFHEQAVAQAIRCDNDVGAALALGYRATSLAGLGEEEAALATVELGLDRAGRILDLGVRDDVRTELLVAWASIADSRPVEALRRIESAIDFAERHSFHHHLPRAYTVAADLRRRLGDPAGEMAALGAAAEEIDRQRLRLADEHDRLTFAALTRKVIEQGAGSLTDQGRWEEAFAFADRLRARELWDALTASQEPPLEFDPAALAAGEGVLSYLVLPDRLLVWFVRRGEIHGFSVAVGREALARLVDDLVAAARSDDIYALHPARVRLSRLLIARLYHQIVGLDRLTVVPDGPLDRLPFAALLLDDGGFLVERASIRTVPAAWILARPGASARPWPPARWLIVADAEHSTQAFPALEGLPADPAWSEAWTASLPGEVELLTGRSATPDAFRRRAPGADVVVFFGHALAPTALSARAGLVLTPGAADDGLLDLATLDLRPPARLRLAILAGCSTGRGPQTAADGSITLGRSLLRSGVPRVVATLWEIEHSGGAEMTALLLDAVAERRDDPVRAAQLRAIGSGKLPPSVWLAFQAVGGE